MLEHIVQGVSSYDTECGNISSKVLVVMIQSVGNISSKVLVVMIQSVGTYRQRC